MAVDRSPGIGLLWVPVGPGIGGLDDGILYISCTMMMYDKIGTVFRKGIMESMVSPRHVSGLSCASNRIQALAAASALT